MSRSLMTAGWSCNDHQTQWLTLTLYDNTEQPQNNNISMIKTQQHTLSEKDNNKNNNRLSKLR